MDLLTTVVPVVLAVVPVLFVVAVAVIVLRSKRAHSVAAQGNQPAIDAAGWPRGQWRARVTPVGSHQLVGRDGALHLQQGWLTFVEDDRAEPVWQVAANQVSVSKYGFFTMSDIRLDSQVTGPIKLVVSREHINRFVENDFKALRERRYADEFLSMVARSGARLP